MVMMMVLMLVLVLQLLLVMRDVDGLVLDEGRLGGEDLHPPPGLDGGLDEFLEEHRAVVHVPDFFCPFMYDDRGHERDGLIVTGKDAVVWQPLGWTR